MPEHTNGTESQKTFRNALRRWDVEREPAAPSFDMIRRRIARAPSPIDTPHWTIVRSLRLVGALGWAQMWVVPWLIIPVALATVTMATLAARFFAVSQGVAAINTGFASVILLGVVATVTMALSSSRPDSIALSTPLGPQAVVLARIAIVLAMDSAAGIAASILVSAGSYTAGFPYLIASWMIPVAFIAAAATFATIWVAPWAGIVAGIVLVPLAAPASDAMFFFGMSGFLWEVLSPLGLLVAGLLLLAAVVASARRAAVSHLHLA